MIPIRVSLVNVPLEKIFPNTWNPNEQSEFVFEKERNSIRTHGFIDPILVREIPEGFEIIDGEHRYKAAKAEMMTEIPCNNLGVVSESVAMQLTIIMNETRGESRRDKLSEMLVTLSQTVALPELQKNLPYEPVEIEALIKQTTIDWGKVGSGGTEGGAPNSDGSEAWEEFRVKLPTTVAQQLKDQIDRFKKALNPEAADLTTVSAVQPIEAICQALSQMPDEALL